VMMTATRNLDKNIIVGLYNTGFVCLIMSCAGSYKIRSLMKVKPISLQTMHGHFKCLMF
jgi:hypothetical protein